ncbi:hypothetical protein QEH53_09905 [Pelagicoccus sp. SDUM812002]|nr:hypothetical protein [Pelagicoccus sp. SDUM812002]
MFILRFAALALFFCGIAEGETSRLLVDSDRLLFSSPQERETEPESFIVFNHSDEVMENLSFRITEDDTEAFALKTEHSLSLGPGSSISAKVVFAPAAGALGVLRGRCELVSDKGVPLGSVELVGLSAPGLEGHGEATLSQAVEALGLGIDVGWESLGNHTRSELVGEEVRAGTFRKASPGLVTIRPVARYSPDFLLPFGIYDAGEAEPSLRTVGTLAEATKTRFEQNCLMPSLASGTIECDPGDMEFGIFTASPSHVAYTQDEVNERLEPEHVAHAVRVYPAKDERGVRILNTFLVCFEEARNGDYQDYVFLVSNVAPVQ